MNEFETEIALHSRTQRAEKAQRILGSRDKSCSVCRVCNPTVLEKKQIKEACGSVRVALLCHNHAKLLFALNKLHFADERDNSLAKKAQITPPRKLVDEFRIAFEIGWVSESVDIMWNLSPAVPSGMREIRSAKELSRIIRRQMKFDPYSHFAECACYVCGSAIPIMNEVHHVDRERNSDRAVFLCANHHALITHYQNTEQPDERDIDDPDMRGWIAAHMGEGILGKIDASFQLAVREHLKERYQTAKAAIENMSRPAGDCDTDAEYEFAQCCD